MLQSLWLGFHVQVGKSETNIPLFNFIKPFLKHLRLRKHFKFMRISWTYLQNRNRPTGAENRLTVAKEEVDGRRMAWECRLIRCKLVHMEWINNKVLLWSTGNSIQYPVINRKGTEYEKECVYTHTCMHTHTDTHTVYPVAQWKGKC